MRASEHNHPARSERLHGGSKRVAKALAAVWMGLIAAGCGEQKLASGDLVTASGAVSVDVGRALALPPPGSLAVTGVTQRS